MGGCKLPYSRLHKIKEVAVTIHQPMPFSGAAGAGFSGSVRVGLVVLLLATLPTTELVLPLNHDTGHGSFEWS